MRNEFLSAQNLTNQFQGFFQGNPFHHAVIDDFLKIEVARQIEGEFLAYESPKWYTYKNALEDKKALNDWNLFPEMTYRLLSFLNSDEFVSTLSNLLGIKLYSDQGLHGGGWHIHGSAGNLNPHLDYSIHPKLKLQRKLNIIIYVSSDLLQTHGGYLGFWENAKSELRPTRLVQDIQPKFNRAVLFDTTQNSWHGFSRPLNQPRGVFRKSLAVYYLCEPLGVVDQRQRAYFAPREAQIGDDKVDQLIKLRAGLSTSHLVYQDKDSAVGDEK
jgi:Rps23 Pro-64 3,4-dihydroxylase Tpa1-like proline 4-hydroxylase